MSQVLLRVTPGLSFALMRKCSGIDLYWGKEPIRPASKSSFCGIAELKPAFRSGSGLQNPLSRMSRMLPFGLGAAGRTGLQPTEGYSPIKLPIPLPAPRCPFRLVPQVTQGSILPSLGITQGFVFLNASCNFDLP